MTQELRTVAHFEQAVEMLSKEQRVEHIPCGPDPIVHVESIYKFVNVGYDHVYIHQIGPDQEGFFRFYQQEILPHLSIISRNNGRWTKKSKQITVKAAIPWKN